METKEELHRVVTRPTLTMSLSTECPECETVFNAFDCSANDEGDLYRQLLPDERWDIDTSKRLKAAVICPNCSVYVELEGVIW